MYGTCPLNIYRRTTRALHRDTEDRNKRRQTLSQERPRSFISSSTNDLPTMSSAPLQTQNTFVDNLLSVIEYISWRDLWRQGNSITPFLPYEGNLRPSFIEHSLAILSPAARRYPPRVKTKVDHGHRKGTREVHPHLLNQ